MRSILVAGAMMAVFAAPTVRAQSVPLAPDQVIAVRKAFMDLQQGIATAMKATVDAKGDVAGLKDGAQGLVASTKVIPSLFPAGTEKGGDTKAKPEVWSDRAGFEKAAANATAAAQKLLASIESGDKGAVAASFGDMGKACGACHRAYKYRE